MKRTLVKRIVDSLSKLCSEEKRKGTNLEALVETKHEAAEDKTKKNRAKEVVGVELDVSKVQRTTANNQATGFSKELIHHSLHAIATGQSERGLRANSAKSQKWRMQKEREERASYALLAESGRQRLRRH